MPAPASMAPLCFVLPAGRLWATWHWGSIGAFALSPKALGGASSTWMGLGMFNEHLLYQPPCWVLGIELCCSCVNQDAFACK